MAERDDKPRPPLSPLTETSAAAPFASETDAWESELDAWDRALPIALVPGETAPHPGPTAGDDARFFETPTMAGSGGDLLAAIPSGRFDDDERAPTSGAYATLVTSVDSGATTSDPQAVGGARPVAGAVDTEFAIPTGASDDGLLLGSYAAMVTETPASPAPTIFDTDPPPDDAAPSPPAETLPEMSDAVWRDSVAGFVMVGPNRPVMNPGADTWRELAGLLEDELAREEAPGRKVDLALACGRVRESLGDIAGARAHVETALANDVPDSTAGALRDGWPAVHRARLCLAAREGELAEDERAAESLARLALLPHPDQPAYRAVQAEWALDRAARGLGGGTAAAFVTAAPEGLPRALADAELAWGEPVAAAAILASAGHARGGRLGAALLLLAASRNEAARDFQAAAEQRYDAAALDPRRLLVRMGLLRDYARLGAVAASAGLRELLPVFAPSPLKVALGRWGARLCERVDRRDEAWSFVADPAELGPVTPALARDRIHLKLRAGGAPLGEPQASELLDNLLAHFAHAPARVIAARFACEWATDAATATAALARLEALRDGGGDLVPLAAAVEEMAHRFSAPSLRLRALRLWRDIDPARWFPACFALADACSASEVDGAWKAIEVRDPASPVFLRRAAVAVRDHRYADAATILAAAARAFEPTRLGVPLLELSAERLSRVDIRAACDRLEMLQTRDSGAAIRFTLGRALRRSRDRERWMTYVGSEATQTDSPVRRASMILECCFWTEDAGSGPPDEVCVEVALRLWPLHPVAVAVALGRSPAPGLMADRWMAAAQATPSLRTTIEAATWLSLAGNLRQALDLVVNGLLALQDGGASAGEGKTAAAARTNGPLVGVARGLIRRLAWSEGDVAARAALLARVGQGENGGELSATPVLGGDGGDPERSASGVRGELAPDTAAPKECAGDRLSRLEAATRAGRWADVVGLLLDAPPHQERPDEMTLSLALALDASRLASSRSDEILARVLGRPPEEERRWLFGPALVFQLLARKSAGGAGSAFEAAARVAAEMSDARSAALFLVEAARSASPLDVIEQHLRAAVEHDPRSAPAASAWRRWLVRAGRIAEAADAEGAEAEALVDPALRVQALLQAAALARSDAPVAAGVRVTDAKVRLASATAFLRRALQIAPQDANVFARLRDLYEEAADHTALADLLALRSRTSTNPFEITSLHLARAELFAGALDDRAAAKAELAAILTKEPHHARALARLADIEEQEGNYAAAAERLVQRSVEERSPEKLRELFLRLGRIHVHHVPDARRAVAAFSRVLHLDGKNREALDALSNLFVGLGDARNATALTEQLLRVEDAPAQRVVYHVRLGQVAERAGDQMAAIEHFRQAVKEAPLDLRAVSGLARFLEKIHDSAGRGQVLDAAAADLRTVVMARPGQAAEREALAAVLRWRGRLVAAAAVTELGLLLGAGAANTNGEGGPAAEGRSGLPDGKRLSALASTGLDDRLFPASVPSSVRQLFRMLGPFERQAYRPDLARFGVERGQRVPEGRPPRDVFDRVAAELGAGPYDLYVVTPGAPSAGSLPPLVAVPGRPPAIVVGMQLLQGGPAAIRFAAARALRLTSSYLDVALADGDAALAVWIAAVVQQFVPGYRPADVSGEKLASANARMAKLIPKKARAEILPFALESSGVLDVPALAAGIRDGANRVGLLASGSLAAALATVLAINGKEISAASLVELAEARALLEFALSDEHDELARLLS